MIWTLSIVATCAALATTGCGDDGGAEQASAPETKRTAASADETRAAATARTGPRVKVRQSQFGTILFDGRDRALYLFTRDRRNRTRCYGDCAKAWPPFLAKGEPRALRGVRQSLLGTIRRRGGARQVTYRGHPLYFYVHDPPRQVLCQNVREFGGLWLVVRPDGRAVR